VCRKLTGLLRESKSFGYGIATERNKTCTELAKMIQNELKMIQNVRMSLNDPELLRMNQNEPE